MSIITEIKESFRENGTVIRLIYINVAIFLVVRLVSVVWPDFIYATLAMPTTWLGALTHPWTLFTYMFTHFDLIHILFNMLCLYWFGRIFEQVAGNHLVLRVYILGGLAGALMCLIGLQFHSVGSYMIGASAAIMALLGAVAALAPNYVVNVIFVGNIRLKYYALIFFLIDIVGVTGYDNIGGHLSHIGGVVSGVLLAMYWNRKGLPKPSEPILKFNFNANKKSKMHVERGSRPMSDQEYNARRAERSREVDRILEKIKSTGYDSLTNAEKQTLFDASKR